jgi:hypothetical protein
MKDKFREGTYNRRRRAKSIEEGHGVSGKYNEVLRGQNIDSDDTCTAVSKE